MPLTMAGAVPLYEQYESLTPTFPVARVVSRLLSSVPVEYLRGLQSIVLTDSTRASAKKLRVSGRTIREKHCLAFYHVATPKRSAWIELFVDNIVAEWPSWAIRLSLLRDVVLAKTLFHEIGHHIEASVRGRRPDDAERYAEIWVKKLSRGYFRKRYWYLIPLILPLSYAWTRIRRSSYNKEPSPTPTHSDVLFSDPRSTQRTK